MDYLRKIISPRLALILLCLISLMSLATAFIAQYGFDLAPCQFCIWERYPYAVVAVLSLLGLCCPKWTALVRVVCVLTFLGATGLTAYHVAVEREWVDPPASCQSDLKITGTTTVADLKAQILAQPRVTRCDIVPIRILGVSMAEMNLVLSLVLMVWSFGLIRRVG